MRRRRFLEGCGQGLAGLLAASRGDCARRRRGRGRAAGEIAADVVIVGGGLGGCAAALAALRAGRTVVLTEPTDWIGGQLTSQAVPPDEHPWIEQFGVECVVPRAAAGHPRLLSPALPADRRGPRRRRSFNPGNGGVSRLCHEPRVALAVLTAMLAPYASSGRLLCPARARAGPRRRAGRPRPRRDRPRSAGPASERSLVAPYFLDATELGDLLPLAGVEFVIGAEAQAEPASRTLPAATSPTTSRRSPAASPSTTSTARTTRSTGPPSTTSGADYVPALQPAWPGRLLDLTYANPITLKPVSRGFDPRGAGAGLWVYRRIVDPRNFQPGAYPGSSGTTLVNWPQNDYWLGPLVGPGDHARARPRRHIARAKQLSLSLLYWLQTECPRPDGKTGWKGLRLRPDLVGTEDGLAKAPYIRESRRIQAEFTVLEQHVGTEARRRRSKTQDVQAEPFPTASASAATGSTCTPAPAATTTSTSARCRSRSRSAP